MMGMSSPEWSRYMHDELGLSQEPAEINDEVVRRMLERYHGDLPLLDGAVEAVRSLAASYPARCGVVLEPAADRRRARDGRHRGVLRGDRLVRGGGRAGSRARTCIWRRRGGLVFLLRTVLPSRTPRTGFAPPTRPGWS